MTYVICNEDEATHVKVLWDKEESYKLLDVTPGKIYKMERMYDTDVFYEGEEVIQDDYGSHIASFSNTVPVIYLKEEIEA